MLKDYTLSPSDGSSPTSAVIILHGYGDSGNGGLLEIGRLWQHALPKTEFLCPDAPFPFEMAPPGYGGRQWFSLRSTDPQDIEAGVIHASTYVNDYLDYILDTRKLKPAQVVLSGFSQGSMLSLYVGPRRVDSLAAIIGFSGMLVAADRLPAERKSAPPTLLVHGTEDEVVPFMSMADAENGLRNAHIPVQSVVCPHMGHGIDDRGIRAGLEFLLENLPRNSG